MSFNPILHEVCLDYPAHIVAPHGWVGHIPFAFAIMSLLRPRVFVELGTHSGNSYLAFCQAAARLRLDVRCFAVDTWEGDVHSGGYGSEILTALRTYHDPHYSHFSTLLQRYFDDALPLFEAGSVDLLHIDGLHTYEAVRHDFEVWLPKMSKAGVILFHDTQVRNRGFGVWKLMDELAECYPLLDFRHSHGLGVAYVGTGPMPEEVAAFFDAPREPLLRLFEHLSAAVMAPIREQELAGVRMDVLIEQGNAAYYKGKTEEQQNELKLSWARVMETEQQLSAAGLALQVAEQKNQTAEQQIAVAQEQIFACEGVIAAIYASSSWRVTRPLRYASRKLKLLAWRPFLGRCVRQVYVLLPLTPSLRYALKSWILTMGAPLLCNTALYRRWRDFRKDGAQIAHDDLSQHNEAALAHQDLSRNAHERVYAALYRQAAGGKGLNQDYVPLAADSLAGTPLDIRLIAFYLPQFHPIPENDEWWGRGFTEWTNVSKAVPQFEGHYQPHLPGELGYYDLRLVDVMRRQVELAKQYGLAGFCFHYYWFGGRRLLELPLNQYLANTDLDLPFCVCWANENWSRRWDGSENSVLMAQVHTPETDEAFIRDVASLFGDSRYIRVMGRPVLIVYRVSLLPDPKATAKRWREYCSQAGIGEIYLICAQSFEVVDPRDYGFDAAVEFPPHQAVQDVINNERLNVLNPAYEGKVYDYRDLSKLFCGKKDAPFVLHKTVVPGWDNESRKPGRGHSFIYNSPAAYAEWLQTVCCQTSQRYSSDQRLVFVNAWNEWAEGAHLEPDRRYGYAYLHATANVLREFAVEDSRVIAAVNESQRDFEQRHSLAVIAHLYYTDLLEELQLAVSSAAGIDAFISLRADVDIATVQQVRAAFPRAYLFLVKNRGRDFLPFLQGCEILQRFNYLSVCKVHGKKSLHLAEGSADRRYLFQALLSASAVGEVQRAFAADSSLGLLAAPGTVVTLRVPDRHVLNRKWLDLLLVRFGASEQIGRYEFDFIAGSMFWFRPQSLRSLCSLQLKKNDFEPELGQIDGTLPHALERLVLFSAQISGFSGRELIAGGVFANDSATAIFVG